jgi:hypothetical protein
MTRFLPPSAREKCARALPQGGSGVFGL